MSRFTAAAGLVLGGAAAAVAVSAKAQELSSRAFFSQRFQAPLTNGSGDVSDSLAVNSVTNLGFLFRAQTPRTRWSLAPGVSYAFSSDEEFSTEIPFPRFNGSVSHAATQRLTLGANASFSPDLVSETQFEDTGRTEDEGIELDGSASVSASFAVDPLNSLSAGLSGSIREFVDAPEDFESTRSVGVSLSWSRRLDPNSSGSLSLSTRRFDSDDGASSLSTSLSAGYSTSLAPTVSLSTSAGLSYSVTERVAQDQGAGRDITIDDENVGFIGSIGVQRSNPSGDVSLRLSQDVRQNAFGDLVSDLVLGLSYSRPLTTDSNVSLGVSARSANPLFVSSDSESDARTLSFRAGYSVDLGWDVSARFGYSARLREDDDRTVTHTLSLRLSRAFDLLP